MNPIDVVKTGLDAVENRQMDKFQGLLADDMVFTGPVPQPVGKQEMINLQTALIEAMPDWKFNATNFKQMGDKVIADLQISGTQTGALHLPMPGLMDVPATGKHVSLPPDPTTFTVVDGKVTKIESMANPQTGVAGILNQLGIPLPPM